MSNTVTDFQWIPDREDARAILFAGWGMGTVLAVFIAAVSDASLWALTRHASGVPSTRAAGIRFGEDLGTTILSGTVATFVVFGSMLALAGYAAWRLTKSRQAPDRGRQLRRWAVIGLGACVGIGVVFWALAETTLLTAGIGGAQ